MTSVKIFTLVNVFIAINNYVLKTVILINIMRLR